MPCRHQFFQSGVPDYERCRLCGTFKSRRHPTQEELYGNNAHWTGGHGSLWEQVWNVDMHTENGVCKNRFVLDRIESARNAALDIGCAPGRMLYWLKHAARFKVVVGIDAADQEMVRRIGCFDGHLMAGFFPQETRGLDARRFDYICGLDVFEHSPAPEEFLAECFRLLTPRGQLFLMSPFADDLPETSRFFAPLEHTYIHSVVNMRGMLTGAGFREVEFDRWAPGHDTASARKP